VSIQSEAELLCLIHTFLKEYHSILYHNYNLFIIQYNREVTFIIVNGFNFFRSASHLYLMYIYFEGYV